MGIHGTIKFRRKLLFSFLSTFMPFKFMLASKFLRSTPKDKHPLRSNALWSLTHLSVVISYWCYQK